MKVSEIVKLYKEDREFEVTIFDSYHQAKSVKSNNYHYLTFRVSGNFIQLSKFLVNGCYELYFNIDTCNDLTTRVFNELCNQYKNLSVTKIIGHSDLGYSLKTNRGYHFVGNRMGVRILLNCFVEVIQIFFIEATPKSNLSKVNKHTSCIDCDYFTNSEYLWCTVAPRGYLTDGCIKS